MSELVISSGIPDSQMYLQNVANVNAPFSVSSSSGNYPMVGNILVNRRLANRWIAVNLASRAFVDGLGVTSMGAESENVGFLRFPYLYLPPRIKRTIGSKLCPNGEVDGTPGNNQPFNKNLPHGMQTDGFDMKFMQEYDEAAQVSRVNMRMIGNSLDLLGQYTSYVPKTVGFMQDADILATHIASALSHAAKTSNRNIIPYNPNKDTSGYLQSIMNSLASSLSNVHGSYKEGIISYPREKSVFVMRWSLFNKLMTIQGGALVHSDVAQTILMRGYLDETGQNLLGSYIYGVYMGIFIKVLPDEMFDTAAATLNLTKDQYKQWNKVVAYIANAEGNLFGMSATVVDIDKAPTTSLGYIIRNDWGWGIKNYRRSSVALVVESSDDNLSDFTNPITSFDDITSPINMEGIIEGYQNKDEDADNANQTMVQRIAVSAPQLITEVTLTVTGSSSAKISDAEVVVRDEEGLYSTVSNKENGTYTFTLPRASTATIVVSAEGYATKTQKVTVTDTATATKSISVALTAAAL